MDALKRIVFLLLLGAAGAWCVRHFFFERIVIATDSMAPTLPQGTETFVNKFEFFRRSPRDGEIILFDSPIEPGKGLVKRVIGVAGDVIEIHAKRVTRNGAALDEPYTQFLRANEMLVGDDWGPETVPVDRLFVLGDNRDVSSDSRDWHSPAGDAIPFLPMSKVKGLVRGTR